MLTGFEYMIVWVIYTVAGVFAMLIVAKISSFLPSQVSSLMKALALVLLFTPWFVNEGQGLMAPAVIVLIFDMLVKEQGEPLRAFLPLMVTSFIAILSLIIHYVVTGLLRKKAA
ncbi:MAG: hypothetical protein KUG82_13305 [Pseudomonadales bacterium]|nr:hypothetical protein [Pseudomonadales bacterium]